MRSMMLSPYQALPYLIGNINILLLFFTKFQSNLTILVYETLCSERKDKELFSLFLLEKCWNSWDAVLSWANKIVQCLVKKIQQSPEIETGTPLLLQNILFLLQLFLCCNGKEWAIRFIQNSFLFTISNVFLHVLFIKTWR